MRRQSWLLVGFVVLLSLVLRDTVLFLIALLITLIGGASAIWKRYSLSGLTYRRHFSTTRVHHGQEVEMVVEVVNAKPLPLALLITVDELPAEFELLSGRSIFSPNARRRLFINSFSLRWYERVTRTYRLRAGRRGVWHFGPTQLSTGDIFGFSVQRATVVDDQTVVVYPRMVPLADLGLPDLFPYGEFKTQRRLLEDPLRAVGAREYVPGDSPRYIHWKATARRQALQTRVFEPSADRPLAIFLNSRTGQYADEGLERHVLELSVTTAASVARWAWEKRYQVGLYANALMQESNQPIEIRPGNRPEQLLEILAALSYMRDDGRWRLATTIWQKAQRLPYGTALVVISPVVNARLLDTLQMLRRKEYGVTLITLGRGRLPHPLPGIMAYHIDENIRWDDVETLALA